MKATIKEFKNNLINNESVFLGVVRKPLIIEEVEIKLHDFLNAEKDSVFVETRKVDKVQTNAVRFTGGSWLYFNSDCSRKVEKKEYEAGTLYIFTEMYDREDGDYDYCVICYFIYNR